MFKELHQLALQTPFTMIVTADGDLLTLTIVPSMQPKHAAPDDIASTALAQPLQLTATPDELTAHFSTLLGRFGADRLSLSQQLDVTAAVIKAAKDAAATRASDAVRGKTKPNATRVTPKPIQQVDLGDDAGDGEADGGSGNESATASAQAASEPKPTDTPATDEFSLF